VGGGERETGRTDPAGSREACRVEEEAEVKNANKKAKRMFLGDVSSEAGEDGWKDGDGGDKAEQASGLPASNSGSTLIAFLPTIPF
jgi:hypothetical protein